MGIGSLKHGVFGAALGLLLALPACGDDDEGEPSASAGTGGSAAGASATGGTGGAPVPGPVACGELLCQPLVVAALQPVAPCCADEAKSLCGLDTSLLEGFGAMSVRDCEPLDQPGEPDSSCPRSAPFDTGSGLEIPPFEGCCAEATGTCGYLVDRVLGVIPIGLGCIDSSPFLEGETPASCALGAGGASAD